MDVILLSSKNGKGRSLRLGPRQVFAGITLLVIVPVAMTVFVMTGLGLGAPESGNLTFVENWQTEIQAQKNVVAKAQRSADEHLRALTVKVAEVEARMIRLDALGEHLVHVAKLNKGEFDFSPSSAMGGPEDLNELGDVYQKPEFSHALDDMAGTLLEREQQLDILESMLVNRNIKGDAYLTGRPIQKGWLSSHYGRRTDPFTGKLAWHKGVDFAGKENSPVISVGSGVITWSGKRYGYGNMVEVSHGDGYVTRYGHNKENLVNVGDTVKKGQEIAKMGTTGRSTGHHVHFEVFLNGKTMDPKKYIYRRERT